MGVMILLGEWLHEHPGVELAMYVLCYGGGALYLLLLLTTSRKGRRQ